MAIPDTLDDLQLEWLVETLAAAGMPVAELPVALVREPMGAGTGFVGQMARLRLCRHDGTSTTLVAKMSSRDPAARRMLNAIGLYSTEAGVYRDLAPQLRLRTPRCYAALYDAGSGATVLLLEDLAGHRFGDATADQGCGEDDARLAVRELAAHHAQWWNHPQLAGIAWLQTSLDRLPAGIAAYGAALPAWEARWAEQLSPELVQCARDYQKKKGAVAAAEMAGPLTLTHGDYRLDNLAFSAGPPPARVTVIDWQNAGRGAGAGDLAYFVAGSFPVERRRALEPLLLDAYHAALCAGGVRDYGREQLARDYIHGLTRLMNVMVIAGGLLDFSDPRGQRLFAQQMERLAAACADHDLGRVLAGFAVSSAV